MSKEPTRHLKLYADDFSHVTWHQVCKVLQLDHEMVDEVAINFHPDNVNPYKDGEYSPEYKLEEI